MAIRKIKNTWWVDFRWAGTRYRKRSPVNTRGGAEQYEVELRKRIMHGQPLEGLPASPVQDSSVMFHEFAEQWYTTYVMVNCQPREQQQRRSVLRSRLIPWFGHMSLESITTRIIEEFKLDELRHERKNKTINNHLGILSRCLRSAVEWGYLDKMPVIQRLRVCLPPFRVLNDDEAARLLGDKAEPMWNLMVRVGLRTGLRRGELMALDWTDIDIQRKRITVHHAISAGVMKAPKTFQIRTVPLTPSLIADLQQHAKASGLIFTNPDGGLCTESEVAGAIRRIAHRLGIRQLGWHTLRHTFATQLAAAGVPLHVVKELLGHSTIAMTMRYAHVVPSMLDDAIRVLEVAPANRCPTKFGQPVGTEAHPQGVSFRQALVA